ncbi:MAG: ATP-binding protein [Candidatus Eiseniibacteriota bacterium]
MNTDTPQTETIQLTIPSRLELLPLVDQLASGISERLEFDDESRMQISISVMEAGTNAIQHGNRVDPGKRVDLVFLLHPDRLEVIVKDKGPGFDLSKILKDITSPEHLLDLRGRGIYMMRNCMDKVDFEFGPDGTTVRMMKSRPKASANGSKSAA